MKPEQRKMLATCNCLGRFASGDLTALRREDDGTFRDPSGLIMYTPDHWQSATPDEIVAHYDRLGMVPIRLKAA